MGFLNHSHHHHDSRHLEHRHQGHSVVLTGLLERILRNKALAIPIIIGVLPVGVIFTLFSAFAVLNFVPAAASLLKQFEQGGVSGLVPPALDVIETILEAGGKG